MLAWGLIDIWGTISDDHEHIVENGDTILIQKLSGCRRTQSSLVLLASSYVRRRSLFFQVLWIHTSRDKFLDQATPDGLFDAETWRQRRRSRSSLGGVVGHGLHLNWKHSSHIFRCLEFWIVSFDIFSVQLLQMLFSDVTDIVLRCWKFICFWIGVVD